MSQSPLSRTNVPSGSYLEPIIGFSRAVRIGNMVAVAGTAWLVELEIDAVIEGNAQ